MERNSFKQSNSLIRRLHMLITFIIAVIVVGAPAIIFSNRCILVGLTKVDTLSDALDLHSEIIELLHASTRIFEKVFSAGQTADITFALDANQQQVWEKMDAIISIAVPYPVILKELLEAKQAIHNYEAVMRETLQTTNKKTIATNMLIANQHGIEAREYLRKAQIELKKTSDDAFDSAYKKRYLPSIVTIVLALISLVYILTQGLPLSKRFKESINNLIAATDSTAQGNLDTKAEILYPDEIGKLTHSFNEMVRSVKENQDRLNEAIATRDEFLSIASHELKTPLTPLKLQLQLLNTQLERGKISELSEERGMKMVNMLNKQIDRIDNLIEDLLDVSRINAGKLKLNRELFDLSEMIEDVVQRYKQQLLQAGCPTKMSVGKAIEANLDRLRVEQVFVNLLTNAIKYAPGKMISIRLSKHDGSCRMEVEDQGPGIAPKDQSRLFNRFEQVKNHDNIGGLGLGLYISKQIVEAHGGRIWIESQLGEGAKFIVELPLT